MSNNLLNRLSGRVIARSSARVVPGTRRLAAAMPVLKEGHLTEILDAMDSAVETRRLGNGEGQYGHYTHVSSLIGACTRMHALAALDDRTISETVTGGHRVMWAIGRHVEAHIRGQYLRATNKRMAYGRWKCICGESEHVGHHPVDSFCQRCHQGLDQYHEFTLFDHENWIKGNPDLLMALKDWIIPVEIKSMTPKQFNDLSAPKGDHIFQLGHYHRMLQLSNFRTHTHGIIIYCTKEFKHGSPYKEFHVEMSAPSVQAPILASVEIARQLRRAREENIIPARTLCTSHTSTRAKQCPFVVSCFSRG